MRPPKRAPLKKKDSTPISSVPDGLGEIFSRYMFNIGKIEQRVRSEPSNGIVINCATGEYEFDPELCNARSDEELVETVRRLERQPKFGRSVFSSVAPDPGQKNKALQAQWREFNKQFEEEYNNKNKGNKAQKTVKTEGEMPPIKKRKPFSKWAVSPPSSSSNSSSDDRSTTSPATDPSLDSKEDLLPNCSSSSSSVVRPVEKFRKFWALAFPPSQKPSASWEKDRKVLSSIRGGCSSSSALASSSSASSSSNTAPTVCSTRSYKSPKKNATKRHKANP
ncbi:hypothetical protein niasHS_012540 [Heterodera schachtii]|uniref:Uncharacterized protein n=2 Tax=Heterodera TaxID=34509 RepID=A0ABD2ICZ8_HETSC